MSEWAKTDAVRTCPFRIALFLITASLVMAPPCRGEIQGDKELLRLIAFGYQANRDKISTWQGDARMSVMATGRPAYDKRWITLSATYVYDAKAGATRWNWVCDEDKWEKGGKQGHNPDPYIKNGMLKGEALYEFGPVTPKTMKHPLYLRVYPAQKAPRTDYSAAFDPMFYFNCVYPHDISAMLNGYYKNDAHSEIFLMITRNGNRVVIEERDRKEDPSDTKRYEFDLANGFNVVSYFARDQHLTVNWTLEYDRQNGVYVPKRAVHHNEEKVEGRIQTFDREVVFTRSVVNQPVDPAEFGLDKLGVQPGNVVQDTRLGIDYTYADQGDSAKRTQK